MSLIWATRGRTWGFRFLLKGDFKDPLQEYEKAFAGTDSDQELCRRTGDTVALRFPDPEGRKDTAGRVTPPRLRDLRPSGRRDRLGERRSPTHLVPPRHIPPLRRDMGRT
jgi:hypothetical protein